MSQTITIQLSDKTFRQLQRAAELAQQPLDALVESSLAHSLPPLLEEIPPAYQADVYPLLMMSDAERMAQAQQTFPPDRWAEYERLLAKKKESALTPQEQMQLDTLHRQADILTFRKGYAAVLLKRHGYHPLSLADLNRAA